MNDRSGKSRFPELKFYFQHNLIIKQTSKPPCISVFVSKVDHTVTAT